MENFGKWTKREMDDIADEYERAQNGDAEIAEMLDEFAEEAKEYFRLVAMKFEREEDEWR